MLILAGSTLSWQSQGQVNAQSWTKPAKLMMDNVELFDLWDNHKKAGVDVQAACTGSLGMVSIWLAWLQSCLLHV